MSNVAKTLQVPKTLQGTPGSHQIGGQREGVPLAFHVEVGTRELQDQPGDILKRNASY